MASLKGIQKKVNFIKALLRRDIISPVFIEREDKTRPWEWWFYTGIPAFGKIPNDQIKSCGACETLEDAEQAVEEALEAFDIAADSRRVHFLICDMEDLMEEGDGDAQEALDP